MMGKKRKGKPRTKMLDDLMEKPRQRGKKREEDSDSQYNACPSDVEGKEKEEEENKAEPRGRKGVKSTGKKNLYNEMKKRAENREAWREWVPRTCLRAEYS